MDETARQSYKVIEHMQIALRDGCRLAARVWMPEQSDRVPVPAILEYLPYRKRDATSVRDEIIHGHFASKGYACLRVDVRGSGDLARARLRHGPGLSVGRAAFRHGVSGARAGGGLRANAAGPFSFSQP